VSTEEGLLPVEFVSRSLHAAKVTKRAELGHCGLAWDPYLVQVCAGFWGYGFKDLHILDERLTSCFDHGPIGTILPARAKSRVDQAVPPDGVKTCRLGVYTGNLSASHKAVVEVSGSKSISWDWEENSQVPESRYLEQFRSEVSGFISLDDILW